MPNPNFFIVGAPKCGTTSVYEVLRRHPEVFMPEIKEPAFFGSDLKFNLELCARNTIQHRENYLALFEKADGFQRIGEASTWYLVSRLAAREIHDFDPSAKIIIMLRNPVDAMYSLHGEFLWNCNENLTDFKEALEAQQQRSLGERVPETAHFPQGLQYEEVVKFYEQVKRYFEVWGSDHVHVILHDDYRRSPQEVLQRVADYLEIDSAKLPSPTSSNSSKPTSLLAMNTFFAKRPGLRRAINRVVPLHLNRRIREIASKALGSTGRTAKIDPQLRIDLQHKLRPDVERLSELLDRDLTHWCLVPAEC